MPHRTPLASWTLAAAGWLGDGVVAAAARFMGRVLVAHTEDNKRKDLDSAPRLEPEVPAG